MPKINVYLPEALARAVRDAQLPVSGICQAALERAVRAVTSVRGVDEAPPGDHPGLGMLRRFTPRARRAIELAEQQAREGGHGQVGTEHLLLGVIDEGANLAVRMLEALEVEPADLRAELVASAAGPATARGSEAPPAAATGEEATAGALPFTGPAKAALERTATEALALGHDYVGCEHLLLGLLAAEGGTAGHVLRRMGLELHTTRRAAVAALAGVVHARQSAAPAPAPAAGTAVLEQILGRLEAIERRLAGPVAG